jgi:hypothetical protein
MSDFNSLITQVSLISIALRFLLNLASLFVVVRFIYFPSTRKEEYVFSYFLIGIMVFLICAFLETVDIQLGLALGLFAVFSILRFRTINYSVKDMTYTFVVIGMAVVNSNANIPPPVIGAISTNLLIVVSVYMAEKFLSRRSLSSMVVTYSNREVLHTNSRIEILADLSVQTGSPVERYVIKKLDLNKGQAEIEIFFREAPWENKPGKPD